MSFLISNALVDGVENSFDLYDGLFEELAFWLNICFRENLEITKYCWEVRRTIKRDIISPAEQGVDIE